MQHRETCTGYLSASLGRVSLKFDVKLVWPREMKSLPTHKWLAYNSMDEPARKTADGRYDEAFIGEFEGGCLHVTITWKGDVADLRINLSQT